MIKWINLYCKIKVRHSLIKTILIKIENWKKFIFIRIWKIEMAFIWNGNYFLDKTLLSEHNSNIHIRIYRVKCSKELKLKLKTCFSLSVRFWTTQMNLSFYLCAHLPYTPARRLSKIGSILECNGCWKHTAHCSTGIPPVIPPNISGMSLSRFSILMTERGPC